MNDRGKEITDVMILLCFEHFVDLPELRLVIRFVFLDRHQLALGQRQIRAGGLADVGLVINSLRVASIEGRLGRTRFDRCDVIEKTRTRTSLKRE